MKEFRVIVRPLEAVTLLPLGLTAQGFALEVAGPLGPDYILQTSTTLGGWSNLLTNTPAELPWRLLDTNAVAFRPPVLPRTVESLTRS